MFAFSRFSSYVQIQERQTIFFAAATSSHSMKMHRSAQKPKTRSIDWFVLHIFYRWSH